MSERLILLGRLREKKTNAEGIKIHCEGLRDQIRFYLDCYEPKCQLPHNNDPSHCIKKASTMNCRKG